MNQPSRKEGSMDGAGKKMYWSQASTGNERRKSRVTDKRRMTTPSLHRLYPFTLSYTEAHPLAVERAAFRELGVSLGTGSKTPGDRYRVCSGSPGVFLPVL